MADGFTSTRFEHSDDCAANALWVNQYRAALEVSRDTRERYATEVAEAESRAAASDALAREAVQTIERLVVTGMVMQDFADSQNDEGRFHWIDGIRAFDAAVDAATDVLEKPDAKALLARGAEGDGDA